MSTPNDGPETTHMCDCVRLVEDACYGALFVSRGTLRQHRAANPLKYPFLTADGPSDTVINDCLLAGWLVRRIVRQGSCLESVLMPKRAPKFKGRIVEPDDVIVCNCAGCDRELWGAAMAQAGSYISDSLPVGVQMLAGRIKGRPYCVACLYPLTDRPDQYLDQVARDPSPEVWKP